MTGRVYHKLAGVSRGLAAPQTTRAPDQCAITAERIDPCKSTARSYCVSRTSFHRVATRCSVGHEKKDFPHPARLTVWTQSTSGRSADLGPRRGVPGAHKSSAQ